jgi:hypothetical protein
MHGGCLGVGNSEGARSLGETQEGNPCPLLQRERLGAVEQRQQLCGHPPAREVPALTLRFAALAGGERLLQVRFLLQILRV